MEWISANQLQAVPNRSSDAQDPAHCVVTGALAHILKISSFFGLAPLSFVSHADGYTVTLSKPMRIYSYILITVLATWSIIGVVMEFNRGMDYWMRKISSTEQMTTFCNFAITMITASVGVYSAPKRMKDILKFVDIVAKVDNKIGWQHSMKAERKLSAVLFFVLILILIFFVGDFCFYIFYESKFDSQWKIVINYTSSYVLWYLIIVLELQFAVTALFVQTHIAAVNDALATTARIAFVHPRSATAPCEPVHRLTALYSTLCDVVAQVNHCYGCPLITNITALLFDITFSLYYTITQIIISANSVQLYITHIIRIAIHVMRMLVIVEPCHKTILEEKRIKLLVCHLMDAAPPGGVLSSRLQIFLNQLMRQSVSYSPLGMLTLDRPLLVSMIGAITTYLVILLQFQSNS